MRDIVLVTTFFRPEFLWVVLQSIADADGGKEKEVWVAHDHHRVGDQPPNAENQEVIDHFKGVFKAFRWIDRTPHAYSGNSYNCLELYKEAYRTNARFVYLIEDDILVEKDFFRWHEAVQAEGDYFCSVARLHDHKSYKGSNDPTEYREDTDEYTSWGVCWRRESLKPLMEHCCDAYYSDMTRYIQRRFPQHKLGGSFTEQDGLIHRVLAEVKGVVASPCLRRANHIGITGYHRPQGYRFTGNLSQRIEQLNEAINAGNMKHLRKSHFYLEDIDTPHGVVPWSELRVVRGK